MSLSPSGKKFEYNGFVTASLFVLSVGLFVFVPMMIIIYVRGHDIIGAAIFLLLLFLPMIAVRAFLSRFSISVNDKGVSASIMGVTTKHIEWRDIQKIRKIRVYNGLYHTDLFEILGKSSNILHKFLVNIMGDISFSNRIGDCRSLLDQINEYARRYQIPLRVIDLERYRRVPQGAGRANDTPGNSREAEKSVSEF